MKRIFIYDSPSEKERLDMFIYKNLKEQISRNQIQKLIKEKKIKIYLEKSMLVSEKIKPSLLLKKGMRIELDEGNIEPKKSSLITPQYLPLNILYEDEYLAIIHKPPGIAVHPASNESNEITLLHGILYHWENLTRELNPSPTFPLLQRPGLVHRLDKMTEGLLIVAKNSSIQWKISRMFQTRQIYKEYLAWLLGCPPEAKGIINLSIMRHPKERHKMIVHPSGRMAITEYEILKTIISNHHRKYTKVKIQLITGRTHQIRAHFHYVKSPVVGDDLYYDANSQIRKYGLLLLAKKVVFEHPEKNTKIEIEIDEPERFKEFEKKCIFY